MMAWFYDCQSIDESRIYEIVESRYTDDMHAEFLNDIYPMVKVGWMDCYAGDTIRKLDPIAFSISRDDEIDYIVQCITVDHDIGYMEQYDLDWVDMDE